MLGLGIWWSLNGSKQNVYQEPSPFWIGIQNELRIGIRLSVGHVGGEGGVAVFLKNIKGAFLNAKISINWKCLAKSKKCWGNQWGKLINYVENVQEGAKPIWRWIQNDLRVSIGGFLIWVESHEIFSQIWIGRRFCWYYIHCIRSDILSEQMLLKTAWKGDFIDFGGTVIHPKIERFAVLTSKCKSLFKISWRSFSRLQAFWPLNGSQVFYLTWVPLPICTKLASHDNHWTSDLSSSEVIGFSHLFDDRISRWWEHGQWLSLWSIVEEETGFWTESIAWVIS
jgi:hypothetical protein